MKEGPAVSGAPSSLLGGDDKAKGITLFGFSSGMEVFAFHLCFQPRNSEIETFKNTSSNNYTENILFFFL